MISNLLLAAKVSGQTLAIFVFLMLALRLLGRGIVSQLTIIGYLIIALLGSAVEASMYGGGGQFVAGIAAATTIFLADAVVMKLTNRIGWLRAFIIGSPLVLVHDGQMVPEHLRRCHLTKEDLMSAIRREGFDSLDVVKYAVLETDGVISIIPEER